MDKLRALRPGHPIQQFMPVELSGSVGLLSSVSDREERLFKSRHGAILFVPVQ